MKRLTYLSQLVVAVRDARYYFNINFHCRKTSCSYPGALQTYIHLEGPKRSNLPYYSEEDELFSNHILSRLALIAFCRLNECSSLRVLLILFFLYWKLSSSEFFIFSKVSLRDSEIDQVWYKKNNELCSLLKIMFSMINIKNLSETFTTRKCVLICLWTAVRFDVEILLNSSFTPKFTYSFCIWPSKV